MVDEQTGPEGVLARLTGTLVSDYDVVSVLTDLSYACVAMTGAGASGLLLVNAVGELEVMVCSSHEVAVLEQYQAQTAAGPCVDAVSSGRMVVVELAEASERWPDVGELIRRLGHDSVCAVPLLWHGRALGALNLFFTDPTRPDSRRQAMATSCADIATLAIVHAGLGPALPHAAILVQQALDTRATLEVAKGVVAGQDHIDLASAYQQLVACARAQQRDLSEVTAAVIGNAAPGRHWDDFAPISLEDER